MAENLIEVTPANYKALKEAYENAQATEAKSFMFHGHEILVAYAKYLLEYMKELLGME